MPPETAAAERAFYRSDERSLGHRRPARRAPGGPQGSGTSGPGSACPGRTPRSSRSPSRRPWTRASRGPSGTCSTSPSPRTRRPRWRWPYSILTASRCPDPTARLSGGGWPRRCRPAPAPSPARPAGGRTPPLCPRWPGRERATPTGRAARAAAWWIPPPGPVLRPGALAEITGLVQRLGDGALPVEIELTGAPGSGRTALAAQAAARLGTRLVAVDAAVSRLARTRSTPRSGRSAGPA